MLSYWERQSFLHYDHIIIGSGITGLSVAIELKQAYPEARVLVLERGLLPTGASTRNAGFACMGSASELLDDLKTQSEEAVISLFSKRKKGLELLRKRLGDEALGYRNDGGFELIAEEDLAVMERLDYLNDLLRPVIELEAYQEDHKRIETFGFAKDKVAALIYSPFEGSIDTGKAIRSLIDLAISKGIEIKTGAEVRQFEENENHVLVALQSPLRNDSIVLYTGTLTVCTNAFTKQLLPNEDIVPGRGQIIITKPIPGLKLKGIFHYDEGYYYFREIDGRVLIGGARNLDFAGERTQTFSTTKLIQEDLESKLREMILPGQHFEIDMRWSGIMAFGKSKSPIIKSFSNRVFGAFRFGGMGIALSSLAAAEIVALIGDRNVGSS
ncbi:MAG: FAD-dependent oxidoreductase [Chitinophagaceae bacterium]